MSSDWITYISAQPGDVIELQAMSGGQVLTSVVLQWE